MKTLFKVTSMLAMIAITMNGNAQTNDSDAFGPMPSFKNSISACPVAVVFGIYSVNYEHLFKQQHGFVVRFDYEDIPKTYTDARIESSGYSFLLNYRYHLNKQMKSCFVGAYVRYRQFDGNGNINGTSFDFSMPDVSFGINAGKKWVWKSGFTLTFALGYGFSNEEWDSHPDTTEVNDKVREFRHDYDFIDPFYGEFSIGYSF